MKLITASILGFFAVATNAQESLHLVSVPPPDCPQNIQSEYQEFDTWGGNTCNPVSNELCADGHHCSILMELSLIGTDMRLPAKFKACNDDQCQDCPHEWDVEDNRVACAGFDGQGYYWLGD